MLASPGRELGSGLSPTVRLNPWNACRPAVDWSGSVCCAQALQLHRVPEARPDDQILRCCLQQQLRLQQRVLAPVKFFFL